MQYKQLQAFIAVVQTGSFSQAAVRLQISQPSVSRLMKDLNEDFGFELFLKQKGRMVPTIEALTFYKEVNTVINGISHLENVAEKLKKSACGSLTIGSTPALATRIVPCLIRDFLKKHPDIHVGLHIESVNHLVQGLKQKKYDLILINQVDYDPGFIYEPLITVDWVCAIPTAHPLAKKEVITPQDLNGENLLTLIDEDGMEWDHHKNLLKEHNIHVKSQFSTQRSLSGYGMVAAGLCIALLEPFNANIYNTQYVTIRPFLPKLRYDYTMYYSAEHIRTKLSREFSDCAKRSIQKHL